MRRQDRYGGQTESHGGDPPRKEDANCASEGCENGYTIKFLLATIASLAAKDTGESSILNLGFLLENFLMAWCSAPQWLVDSGVKVSFAESLNTSSGAANVHPYVGGAEGRGKRPGLGTTPPLITHVTSSFLFPCLSFLPYKMKSKAILM